MAALSERFGEAEVEEVLAEVVRAAARESGAAMRAEKPGSEGMSAEVEKGVLTRFAEAWEPWFRGGALEIDELERAAEAWSFDVTRCRYAELYRALGIPELGATLSCNHGAALIEGFDPEVTFRRT